MLADPAELLRTYAKKAQKIGNIDVGKPGSKEWFDTGDRIIGLYKDKSGHVSETTVGIIHYGKQGAHIVPGTPRGR